MLNKYKKTISIIIVVIFLLLDCAALDDIITGNEPSLLGEYACLILSLIVFGVIWWWLRRKN